MYNMEKEAEEIMEKQNDVKNVDSFQAETTKEENDLNSIKETKSNPLVESILEPIREIEQGSSTSSNFEQFVDERILISHDALGKKEMKIKVLEISDERSPSRWKFGDRVKLNKILITIKHLQTQEIEEGELDISKVEKELVEKRHYSSTNRWIPVNDIKNGYVIGSRHMSLISDALALEYIVF